MRASQTALVLENCLCCADSSLASRRICFEEFFISSFGTWRKAHNKFLVESG
jgi:hypothetical protein